MRDKVWSALVNLKFKGYVIAILLGRFQKRGRTVDVFLAVASSTSIAAWALWKKFEIVWAGIIAVSQVLTVIKPYYPFRKYATEFTAKCAKIDLLNIEFERLWDKMQLGTISDDDASETYYSLQRQVSEVLMFGEDTIFDVPKSVEDAASKRVDVFLRSNYGVTILEESNNNKHG